MIREATPEDLPRLRAIQAVALVEPWPELLTVAVDGPPLCLVSADPDPTGYALAIVDDDGKSGSVGQSGEVEESDGLDESSGPVEESGENQADPAAGGAAYLAELAVAEGHRGEGRGSALLAALVDRLRDREIDRLRLTVRVVDDRARSFYEDRGFAVVERLPDEYESCDGLLLGRRIQR